MRYLAYLLLVLWSVETIGSFAVAFRAFYRFPLTSMCLLIRSGLYAILAIDWYTHGPDAYHAEHLATAWAFRVLTILTCMESVWLMAQGIPRVRWFALASSLLFAGMGVLVAMATGGMLRGEWVDAHLGNNVAAYRNLSVGCMVYLVANHWLYERARPMGELATQHWRGAVVLVAGLMVGYWLEGHGQWATVTGQYVVRLGSLAALLIWGKGETKWHSGAS